MGLGLQRLLLLLLLGLRPASLRLHQEQEATLWLLHVLWLAVHGHHADGGRTSAGNAKPGTTMHLLSTTGSLHLGSIFRRAIRMHC